MKRCFCLLVVLLTTAAVYAQINIPGVDVNAALKQALEQGTNKSVAQLSAVDGYFGNATVKVLFPPEAQKVESTLRRIGQNKLCDDIILSLNRAAEDAAKQAAPIFLNAIKQMTLQDATNILLGPPDAATQYFKKTTTPDLVAKFRPVIQASLDKVGATALYGQAAKLYNNVPFVPKVNPDLAGYTTQKAIDGLFIQIAVEEINIRQNIGARSTPLLQKVFAVVDRNKK